MIEQLILFIILVTLVINIINILKLIWYNDYFKKNYDNYYISNNKSLYELETYRNKLADFLYNPDDKTLNNIRSKYIITYYIILILLIILIILSLKYTYNNNNNLIFSIIKIIILIFYYKISTNIIKKFDKIYALKFNKTEQIYKYYLTFKILNSLLYLTHSDNIFQEIFEYNTNMAKNEKTFDEQLSLNIGNIHQINNNRQIEYIKDKAKKNLNFLKYINLNEISPFYFKDYFKNIYVIIENERYYINNKTNTYSLNLIIRDKLITSGEKEGDIENIDFIKFFIENNDLIFKLINIKGDIIDNIDMIYDLFYSIIILIIILLLFLHFLYYEISSNSYVIILLVLFVILSIYIWFTLNSTYL